MIGVSWFLKAKLRVFRDDRSRSAETVLPETNTSLNSVESFTLSFVDLMNNKSPLETKQCSCPNSLATPLVGCNGELMGPRSPAGYLSMSLYLTDTHSHTGQSFLPDHVLARLHVVHEGLRVWHWTATKHTGRISMTWE